MNKYQEAYKIASNLTPKDLLDKKVREAVDLVKEACDKKGSFCIGCKDAFKAKFNKIKNQSENVFDLIEKGDLVNTVFDLIYQVVIIAKNVVIAPQWAFDLAVVTAIYKPDSEGNYIKVWEKKDKDENNT